MTPEAAKIMAVLVESKLPLTALEIQQRAGLSFVVLYEALVNLDANRLARIVLDRSNRARMPKRYWEAA